MTTYREAEQLIILAEECSEVTKCATKILRFGKNPESVEDLKHEIGDLLGIIEWVAREHGFSPDELVELGKAKQDKMLRWTSYQQ